MHTVIRFTDRLEVSPSVNTAVHYLSQSQHIVYEPKTRELMSHLSARLHIFTYQFSKAKEYSVHFCFV